MNDTHSAPGDSPQQPDVGQTDSFQPNVVATNRIPTDAVPTDAVRLFWLSVAEMQPLFPILARLLSPQELNRAANYPLPHTHRQFVTGRAVLRLLLGEHLGLPPQQVEFAFGPAGKPRLATGTAGPAFNLSHSGDLVALAWGVCEVGLDVEQVNLAADLAADVAALASAAWGTAAGDRIRSIPNPADRALDFYRRWVGFEAQRKFDGRGIFTASGASQPAATGTHNFRLFHGGNTYLGAVVCPANRAVTAAARQLAMADVARMSGR